MNSAKSSLTLLATALCLARCSTPIPATELPTYLVTPTFASIPPLPPANPALTQSVTFSPPTPSPTPATSDSPVITRDNANALVVLQYWPIPATVFGFHWTPVHGSFILGGSDGILRYDAASLQASVLDDSSQSFAISPRRSVLLVRHFDGHLDFYRESGTQLKAFSVQYSPCPDPLAFAITDDASLLASSWIIDGGPGIPPVSRLGITTLPGDECLTVFPRLDGYVTTLAFSPSALLLVTSTTANDTFLWDLRSGSQLCSFVGSTAEFSPNGSLLSVYGDGRTIALFDPTTCQLLRTIGGLPTNTRPDLLPEDITFSPDGSLIAAGIGPSIMIWDAETGQLAATLTSGAWSYSAVEFSPDGQFLLSLASQPSASSPFVLHRLLLWAIDSDAA